MSKRNHTPGPWADSNGLIIPKDPEPGVFCLVAEVRLRPRSNASSAEGEANAKLISATPEMLEALEDLIRAWSTPEVGDKRHEAIQGAVARAYGAVTKATGSCP